MSNKFTITEDIAAVDLAVAVQAWAAEHDTWGEALERAGVTR